MSKGDSDELEIWDRKDVDGFSEKKEDQIEHAYITRFRDCTEYIGWVTGRERTKPEYPRRCWMLRGWEREENSDQEKYGPEMCNGCWEMYNCLMLCT